MTIPIMPIIPRAMSVAQRPISTPVKANGIENIITNGPIKDSNCEAITIYTRMMISTISRPISENISC